ncbi:MAG: hypothetical protein GX178_00565 [Acidobacteria bacterium]|nr:hypothetical protein [Thermoanaerobaculia bacterium]MDI9630930.1 hypothetical protein [Acidobacteriota bacterium]MBP7812375.1 hypothetical protein [Thermoanaerobaculia bacterium]NLN10087.1 hypothetical protein [Acidobacteriota bacterium]HPA94567.1 hypothetical protein [Thermoanaerobaculia bacterium]
MGIPRGTARLLLDEARRHPFSGRLLELGRMSIYCTEAELREWAAEQEVTLADPGPVELSHQPELARQGCLSDRTFFRLLGFAEVESADVSDWERPDHLLDLNEPLPAGLAGRFDAVFEAGTIQHVFHLPRVFANLHALLKPGGRMVHGMAPSTNHVDHGFYMFSPTLFHDFYTANGWRLDAEWFFEFFPFWVRGRFDSPRWPIRRYEPGCLDHLAYGGFRARQVGLFVAATKVAGATGDRIPQQSYFARFHAARAEEPAAAGAGAPGVAPPPAWQRSLKCFRARLLRLRPRRLPPVVVRY